MARSKCPSCTSNRFEIVQHTPHGSRFILNFIQCASCGAVVGVQEYNNVGHLLHKLAEKLNIDLDR